MKLLIVDDEEWTSQGLLMNIPWEELGISHVFTASDGIAALHLAETHRPDIVISDIRMPRMDGLTFSEKLYQINPEAQVLFLSGYSDKEYLLKAIRLRAVDYIEKPLRLDVVIQAVRVAIKNLHTIRERADNISSLENTYNESLPLLLNKLAILLTDDSANIREKKRCMKDFYPEVDYTSGSVTTVLPFRFGESLSPVKKQRLRAELYRRIDTFFTEHRCKHLVGLPADDYLILHLFPEDSGDRKTIKQLCGDILAFVGNIGPGLAEISMAAVIGKKSEDISGIYRSFRSAAEAMWIPFYLGYGKAYYADEYESGEYHIDRSMYVRFKKAIREADIRRAFGVVDELTDRLRHLCDPDIIKIRNLYFTWIIVLYEAYLKHDERKSDPDRHHIWENILRIGTIDSLAGHVKDEIIFLHSMIRDNDETGGKTVSQATLRARRYIEDEYHTQVNLDKIAEQAFVTPTYLCFLFKKECGLTIHDYITRMRIEKAKNLLSATDMTNYEIALRVGYNDSNYFSKAFRRETGKSPTEFRNSE